MKKYELIKKEISELGSSIEIAGYLAGIDFAAKVYCDQNCPEELVKKGGKMVELSIYGMCCYLDSEVENV